jgi:hypothetical protein
VSFGCLQVSFCACRCADSLLLSKEVVICARGVFQCIPCNPNLEQPGFYFGNSTKMDGIKSMICKLFSRTETMGGVACSASAIAARSYVNISFMENASFCELAPMADLRTSGLATELVCCNKDLCNGPPPAPEYMPAPGPTAPPIVTMFLVRMQLSLSLTKDEFTAKQKSYAEQIAITAGLTAADSIRVVFAVSTATSRRLLAGVLINATIFMPSAAAATTAAAALTESALNANLQRAGLAQASQPSFGHHSLSDF